MYRTVGVISGGFDPLHSGHINYIQSARKECDYLVVGVNSDEWLINKKGKYFLPFAERTFILQNIVGVNKVLAFDDSDGSAIDLIEQVKKLYYSSKIIFMNGGDRTAKNIPEMSVKDVIFRFGIGGEVKQNSSSWILRDWENKQ